MGRITDTIKHLLIINVIFFFAKNQFGDALYDLFALHYFQNPLFEIWQPLTHMFMHGGFQHLLFNMFALFMFGTAVERVFGQRKFLIFYISSGLGAVALTFAVYYIQIYPLLSELQSLGFSFDFIKEVTRLDILSDRMFRGEILASKLEPVLSSYGYSMSQLNGDSFRMLFDLIVSSNGSMVGASGAIMGVLVAFGMLNPNAELMMFLLPIPIKAKYFIPGIIALDLFSAFTGVSIFSPSNTAYIAHIGGALTGFLLMYFWKKNQFDKFRWN